MDKELRDLLDQKKAINSIISKTKERVNKLNTKLVEDNLELNKVLRKIALLDQQIIYMTFYEDPNDEFKCTNKYETIDLKDPKLNVNTKFNKKSRASIYVTTGNHDGAEYSMDENPLDIIHNGPVIFKLKAVDDIEYKDYKSEIIDSPTYIQALALYSNALSITGDWHYFLEGFYERGEYNGIKILEFCGGS
jgi:hypothetical protein